MSARRDGRGHWPTGKRRSPLNASDVACVVTLVSRAIRSGHSIRRVAKDIGVAQRTISRWIKREDWPTLASANKVRAWGRAMRTRTHLAS